MNYILQEEYLSGDMIMEHSDPQNKINLTLKYIFRKF